MIASRLVDSSGQVITFESDHEPRTIIQPFRRDDLPIASKVANMAYVWIWDQDATFVPDRAVG